MVRWQFPPVVISHFRKIDFNTENHRPKLISIAGMGSMLGREVLDSTSQNKQYDVGDSINQGKKNQSIDWEKVILVVIARVASFQLSRQLDLLVFSPEKGCQKQYSKRGRNREI